MNYKKPRLGQKVYIVYNEKCIILTKVYMKGKDAFCIEDSFNSTLMEDARQPIYYDQYNKDWFTTFKDAKNSVLDGTNIIKKIYDGYWEVYNKEDK